MMCGIALICQLSAFRCRLGMDRKSSSPPGMGCNNTNTIQMQCLEQDVAWDLFSYYVGDEIIRPNSHIEYIAKQMVALCRGFPSALCTIGRSMSNQRQLCQWIVAYDMLMIKRPLPDDIKEMSDVGYPCLRYFEDELGDPLLFTSPKLASSS